jgi:hypothetical protein
LFHEGEGVGVFGRRRREAEIEARDAITQALARVERRLEVQAESHGATDLVVQHLHSTVVATRNDLIDTVRYLYEVCSQLIERSEAAHLEREMLIATLSELTGPPAIESPPAGERVLGGSFPATTVESDLVDLVEPVDLVEGVEPVEAGHARVEIEPQRSHWA